MNDNKQKSPAVRQAELANKVKRAMKVLEGVEPDEVPQLKQMLLAELDFMFGCPKPEDLVKGCSGAACSGDCDESVCDT